MTETTEAAIREVVARIEAGFQTRTGATFASAFAPQHDYVIVDGTLIPNLTREKNAEVHQRMFEGAERGALGSDLSQIEARCEVQNIRVLSPEIAVVHFITRTTSNGETMTSAVVKKEGDEWLIVAYHNSFVQTHR